MEVLGIAEHRVAEELKPLCAHSGDGTGTKGYSPLDVASLHVGTPVPLRSKPGYQRSPVFPTKNDGPGTTT